jgi:hypothetical protein
MKDITLVTAATKDYLKKLRWCLPTWTYKKQFKDLPLIIFYSGDIEKDLQFAKDHFKEVKLIKWEMEEYENDRELMISAFVLGVRHIDTEYFIKLDADCFITESKGDPFDPEDFEHDISSHSWGYTKPKWFIDAMDLFMKDKEYKGSRERVGTVGAKRIQSFCCLHKTMFVKKIAGACGGKRLPIPSHDTYCWYLADHFSDCSWNAKNMKKRGVSHASRWKSIREEVCKGETAWNPYLNKELLTNVQIEITSVCNIGCNNCDRLCGIAKTDDEMTVDQIKAFVDESISLDKKWGRIDVIGGEPSMHKNFTEVIEELGRYKQWNPNCKMRYTTNGLGELANKRLSELPDYYHIRNSAKTCKEQDFEAVTDAPVDKGFSYASACSIPWRCGIALNSKGYYLCGAGAGVARVSGVVEPIVGLSNLSADLLKKQRDKLCNICGHSNSGKIKSSENIISPVWQKYLEEYND